MEHRVTTFDERIAEAARLVLEELMTAAEQFGAFRTAHEGYAVLLEEVDELWDAIKNKETTDYDKAREAVQVAAMGMRMLIDIFPDFLERSILERGDSYSCVYCFLPISPGEPIRGAGDGRGQQFAHDVCYWRHEVGVLSEKLKILDDRYPKTVKALKDIIEGGHPDDMNIMLNGAQEMLELWRELT